MAQVRGDHMNVEEQKTTEEIAESVPTEFGQATAAAAKEVVAEAQAGVAKVAEVVTAVTAKVQGFGEAVTAQAKEVVTDAQANVAEAAKAISAESLTAKVQGLGQAVADEAKEVLV